MPLAEWIVAVYLGAAHSHTASLALAQPTLETNLTFADVAYRGDSFRPPLYYGVRVSFFPRPDSRLGFEAEFIHLKVYAQTDRITRAAGTHRHAPVDRPMQLSDVIGRFSISHGLNLMLANVVARRTIGSSGAAVPRVQFVARLGGGPTLPHPESTIDGVSYEGYELGRLALQAAGGMEFRLARHFAVIAEYKFTRTTQRVAVDHGSARGTFASHHGIFGVAWHSR